MGSAVLRWAKLASSHAVRLDVQAEVFDLNQPHYGEEECDEDCELCYGPDALIDRDAYFAARLPGTLRATIAECSSPPSPS